MVVITLRADFYDACASYPRLREALARNQEYIGAMNDEEIRRAIEEPAQRGRWELEPGLVDLLLHDVGHEPGALPLLSHALFETWQRRRGRVLTLSGYASSGGVRGAIAETAETVFADQFTNEQRSIARRIFLRLTELSDESSSADTRRRASFEELILRPAEASTTREVLKVLADARLVTTTEDAAEVAHEALIREWPTLRSWLEENRESLRLHRQLTEAAREWQKLDRTPDLLYRGARLAQAREWITTHPDEVNELEHEFLTASGAAWEREASEREERRRRELASAKELAETQRQSALRLQTRNRVITTLGSIAVILAMLAVRFGLQSRNEKRIAISRELASAAVSNLEVDPELSMMLSVQALDSAYTREAEAVLHRALQASRVRITLSGHAGGASSAIFGPDGKTIASVSGEGEVTVWETASGQKLFSLPGRIARYSPDGARLATGGEDGQVTIWDFAAREKLLTLKGNNKRITDVDFSLDGKLLASADGDGNIIVWNTRTGEEVFSSNKSLSGVVLGSVDNTRVTFSVNGKLPMLISLHETEFVSQISFWAIDRDGGLLNHKKHNHELMIFSPDGRWLVSSEETESNSQKARISLRDISNMKPESFRPSAWKPFVVAAAHDSGIADFAFSLDGSMLASVSYDGIARVWDISSTRPELLMTLLGHTKALTDVAFSPDGTRLATASLDGTVRLWDITPEGSGEWFAIAGRSDAVYRLALTQDGKYLATASPDGAVKVWELAWGKKLLDIISHGGPLVSVAISPDGKLLATAGGDNNVKIWQLHLTSGAATAELLHTLRRLGPGPLSVDFSPDGKKLATGGNAGIVNFWDMETGRKLFSTGGHSFEIRRLAFSPDGNLLAMAGDSPDILVKTLDVRTGEEISTFTGHDDRGSGVADIVVSPDGEKVATVSGDGSLKIWDAKTGEEALILIGATNVNAVDFSADGKYLATVSSDGTARKWDASSGEELVVYRIPGSLLEDVEITPDGTKIIVSGAGFVYGYVFGLDETIRLARSRLTRWFTLEECRKYLHQEACLKP